MPMQILSLFTLIHNLRFLIDLSVILTVPLILTGKFQAAGIVLLAIFLSRLIPSRTRVMADSRHELWNYFWDYRRFIQFIGLSFFLILIAMQVIVGNHIHA